MKLDFDPNDVIEEAALRLLAKLRTDDPEGEYEVVRLDIEVVHRDEVSGTVIVHAYVSLAEGPPFNLYIFPDPQGRDTVVGRYEFETFILPA